MISTESTLIAIFITLVLLLSPGCDSETAKNEQNGMIDAQTLNSRIRPALTIEESLGVAYMHPEALEREWHHFSKKVDPIVIPQIRAILQDKTLSRHWPSAAESLAFVGESPEALLLIETIKQGEIPLDPGDAHLVRHFYGSSLFALGLMARRNIPEAKKVASQFCEQEFWGSIPDHGDPFFILDMRREAIYAKAVADWDIDPDLYQRLRQSNDPIAAYIDEADIEDGLCRMDESEDGEISNSDRQTLMYCYNAAVKAKESAADPD
jgi:hypothetical protein